ncbi:hypothetical protein Esi_0052_0068 [Ectocarpus siliculosus]|uniref:Uncharacterized protein n=1 Tax=Ectocarpus siliculosus TaxID=2880 RepID=D8LP45_ECTSI|nr:hypothetical protein Esi_0052_0068 [Ectocarpus siliculosus]|eukprot:CBN80316.1 hypothetical protein Esi_0052_0068 [Ectocarpus siliculosus]
MEHFWYLLSHGMLNVHSQDVHQRTVLFNLESFDACAGDFLTVLQLYEAIGGDLDHKDRDGNSLLMRNASDNLGMALVWAGASAYYSHKGVWKRGLSIAAARGFRGTMRAIVARDAPDQEFVDRSLNAAALRLSNDGHEQDMSGIRILVDVYGASVNRCGTLANCVHRNPFVVSALISLGADRTRFVWDWERGLRNTALHRVAETHSSIVFQALAQNLSPEEWSVQDEFGFTPMMTLLSERTESVDYLRLRFDWLVERGASCLPFDNGGRRVSGTFWGQRQPFRGLIAARVCEENWAKRRGFILLRKRGVDADDGDDGDRLVLEVAFLVEFGVFQNIVGFV